MKKKLAGKRKEAANMSAAANSGNKSSKISIDHQVRKYIIRKI
jgi:hypothetical protein